MIDLLAHHLRRLIKINRQIINKLYKDEADNKYLRKSFNKRENHIENIVEITPHVDKLDLSKEKVNLLKRLFERFNKQSTKIETALDGTLQKSKKKLDKAVGQRKAEEGYKGLM